MNGWILIVVIVYNSWSNYASAPEHRIVINQEYNSQEACVAALNVIKTSTEGDVEIGFCQYK